ncbi:hypothetical protein [Methylomicrobium lacus]|uniref:hypothetical protein n=1 Tax=Methylomicrobium lacus TaxID=136992 RepID=UPI0035A97335
MHIRDKTIFDIFGDLMTLKPSEVWKLLGAVIVLLSGFSGSGYYIGGLESRLDAALCKMSLERRTQMLSDFSDQAAGELQTQIQSELKSTRNR